MLDKQPDRLGPLAYQPQRLVDDVTEDELRAVLKRIGLKS